MKLTFCGAAREVTGSAHLITLENGFTILLDCGLYQGNDDAMENFNSTWLFDPAALDCLVLSHAHIDHSGRIPKLVRDGFSGTIHCTHATRSLCSIMLLDSAKIQENDAEYYNKRLERNGKKGPLKEPLYTTADVQQAMNLFNSYGYGRWFSVHPDVDVLFRDAGHILGSATVTLRIREGDRTKYVGFTGDVGRPERPILRDPDPMPEVDYLLCESTYGDRLHAAQPQEMDRFQQIIEDTCVKRKGKLIIPAFSVGRTQELVFMLDMLETEGKLPKIPVFVDSPLAVNATHIFWSHPECFDDDLHEYMLVDPNPFGFNELRYIKATDESKALNTFQEPCIIISSAGMINAGRIQHHVRNSVDQSRNTILIVGYCAPYTPCGILREGGEKIRIFGEDLPVRAHIEVMDSFSAHADQQELLDFVANQRTRVQEIFLVHGTEDRQQVFSSKLREAGFQKVTIPVLGESVKL